MPDEIEATAATLRLLADSICSVFQVADEMGLSEDRACEMANGYLTEMREFLTGSALLRGSGVTEGQSRDDFDGIVTQLRDMAAALEC